MATTLQCGCVYTVGDYLPTEFCNFHKPFSPQPDPKDAEIARLKERAGDLFRALAFMDMAGMRVRSCWYSPNVLDLNYAAGAINGSKTCDCWPCRRWRGEFAEEVNINQKGQQ
jgi:hypothetical protein